MEGLGQALGAFVGVCGRMDILSHAAVLFNKPSRLSFLRAGRSQGTRVSVPAGAIRSVWLEARAAEELVGEQLLSSRVACDLSLPRPLSDPLWCYAFTAQ